MATRNYSINKGNMLIGSNYKSLAAVKKIIAKDSKKERSKGMENPSYTITSDSGRKIIGRFFNGKFRSKEEG